MKQLKKLVQYLKLQAKLIWNSYKIKQDLCMKCKMKEVKTHLKKDSKTWSKLSKEAKKESKSDTKLIKKIKKGKK